MKQICTLLLALMMVFVLSACEKDDTIGNTDTPGISQGGENAHEGEAWAKKLHLPAFTAPKDSTVRELGDAVFFEKDGGFSDEEKLAFMQTLWTNCTDVSSHGVYDLDKDTDTATKTYDSLDAFLSDKDDWQNSSLSLNFTNKNGYWVKLYISFTMQENAIRVEPLAGRLLKD